MSGKSRKKPEPYDPWEDPGWKRYADRARKKLLPMIEDSAVAISLVPHGPPDVKFSLELGFMIMLDKPILALVPPGTKVPNKLILVADEIVEGDIDDPTAQARIQAALSRMMEQQEDKKA